MDGWIKLHRKTLENPVVCKDADHVAVWMYLLMNATHKEYPAMFAGQKIMLQPGQLITGRQSIAAKFNISESKVQRIMKSFEIEQQIEQQTSNKNRLISILSWHDYQSVEQQDEQQVNNKRTTTEQQVNTNKNVENDNNDENVKEDIKTIYDFWNSLEIIKHRELTQKMKSGINARLEGRTADEIIQAMQNYKTIITSDLYWYTYKFSLDKFMNPKNLDGFMTDNNPFETYRKQTGGGKGAKFGRSNERDNGPGRKAQTTTREYTGTPGSNTVNVPDDFEQQLRNFD